MKNEKITVRKCGQIEIYNSINKSNGYKTLNGFLKGLSKNLIERSAMYLRNVEDYPAYAYSEKSFHTILTPSIDLLTKKYLIESPIRRISKGNRYIPKKDSHGWVDYWIEYENIEIFHELKHGSIATNSKSTSARKFIQNLWSVMDTQLNHLEHNAKEYQNLIAKSKTLFRVGMTVVPFYQWSNKKENIIREKLHFQNIHTKISEEIDPNPKWTSLFWMRKTFQDNELLSKVGDRYCYRPGFMILLNVKEIHKI